MKKVILIDLDCNLVESISKSKLLHIDTIAVSSDMQVKEISSKYNIENILSMESVNDFYINQEIDLDYEMVELFRSTQLKVEHFLSRLTTDINSIQYIYYSALSYWYSKFKHENIEAVFSAGIEYGSTFDTVIYDVAKHYKKKVFIMEIALSNGKVIANQLFDYVNKKHLKVNDVINEVGVINIEDFLFNSPAPCVSIVVRSPE